LLPPKRNSEALPKIASVSVAKRTAGWAVITRNVGGMAKHERIFATEEEARAYWRVRSQKLLANSNFDKQT